MTANHDAVAALAEATRIISEPRDLGFTLRTIADVARESLADVDQVGISTMAPDGRLETVAATDPLVRELDRLQQEVRQGPTFDAVEADPVAPVEHPGEELRWPDFTGPAIALGVRSLVSVRVQVDDRTRGAFTAYSLTHDTLSTGTRQMSELFAAHAGLAFGHARRREHLTIALETRKVIGMALGLVMQRHDLSEQTAFAYLTRLSATAEIKLREVAANVIAEHHERIGWPDAGSADIIN